MVIIQIVISSLFFCCAAKDTKPPYIVIECGNNDTEVLAKVIAAECSICSEEEQILVGMTILNRVSSVIYPGSIEEVVFQDFQFANIEHIDLDYYEEIVYIAEDLIINYLPANRPLFFVNKNSNNQKFLNFVSDGGFTKPYFYHIFK